jgi:hypothetical protein
MLQRARARLIAIYVARFGQDAFERKTVTTVVSKHVRDYWLKRGYAYWRKRLTLNSTYTSAGASQ